MQTRWTNHEAIAFAETVSGAPSNLITACRGWTAHDVLAHAVAGGGEIARLVGIHLAGDPVPSTISFEDREPAFRALPYDDLVTLVSAGGIFDLLAAMAEKNGSLEFTGWEMNADTLALHVRSELAMHRWDIAGSDPTSIELLSQPDLTAHAIRAINHFDFINERAAARTRRAGVAPLDVRLRVKGEPDVIIRASTESTELCLAEPDDSPALITDAAARLLMLWGRQPPAAHRSTTGIDNATLVSLQNWLY
ncbi:MAG: maleylpyruvate isomerase N-terminal domain-containing protein [Ilumatobacter sp.]|uniref:maleylpyruvate isomerase N-terminal domain-containing protein n=1 Tax=Ilumatobacter sp. TaxID=1967498 RepID=UPI003919D5E7